MSTKKKSIMEESELSSEMTPEELEAAANRFLKELVYDAYY